MSQKSHQAMMCRHIHISDTRRKFPAARHQCVDFFAPMALGHKNLNALAAGSFPALPGRQMKRPAGTGQASYDRDAGA
jgi:hypothetical protein